LGASRGAFAGHATTPAATESLHLGQLNDLDSDASQSTSGLVESTRLIGDVPAPVLLVRNLRSSGDDAIRAYGSDTAQNNFVAGRGVQGYGGDHTSGGPSDLNQAGTGLHGIGGGNNGLNAVAFAGDGVLGEGGTSTTATARHGAGVRGVGGGSTGSRGPGVIGETNSNVHPAVGASNTGNGFGVFGSSSSGVGVRGLTYGATTAGVEGVAGGAGPGVWGFSTSGHAVLGNSTSGAGGVFSSSSGYGASVSTTSGAVGVFAKGAVFAFQGQGSLTCTGSGHFGGGIVVATRLADGTLRGATGMTSAQPIVEDFGRVRLVNGSARVELDPIFAQIASTSDYSVFVTPRGPAGTLYTTAHTPTSFEIREATPAGASLDVDFRIVARRADALSASRFARVDEPPPPPRFPDPPELSVPAERTILTPRRSGVFEGDTSGAPVARPTPRR
jgi:hypothetical protein